MRNDKTTIKMKRTLKSKNVATLVFATGKNKAVGITFKNKPTTADIEEAEALAVKQKNTK